MQAGDVWRGELERNISELNLIVETTRDFSRRLTSLCRVPDSPVSAVLYTIEVWDNFSPVQIGFQCQREADGSKRVSIGNNQFVAKLEYWFPSPTRASSLNQDTMASIDGDLTNLLESFWKPGARSTPSKLPGVKLLQDTEILQRSIHEFLRRYEFVSLVFADLDHLGEVNNTKSYDKGSEVLSAYGALITQAVAGDGVALHYFSGDEIIILLPSASQQIGLNVSYRLASAVAGHDFGVGEIRISNCAGIVSVRRGEQIPPFGEIFDAAVRTVKPERGGKLRGMARLVSPARLVEHSNQFPIQTKISTSLGLIKSRVFVPEPFASPWLNLISEEVFRTDIDPVNLLDVSQKVEALLAWVNPKWDEECIRSAFQPEEENLQPTISHHDVVMAVAHGLTRKILEQPDSDWPYDLALFVQPDQGTPNHWKMHFRDGSFAPLFRFEAENLPYTNEGFDLGFVPRISDTAKSGGPLDARFALLIRIGNDPIDIPQGLFADIIIVDDRPTVGGGLPDFWEATVARLVSAVEKYPNVCSAFVLGQRHNGAQTIEKLETLSTWTEPEIIEKLQYKTGMSLSAIRRTAKRLENRVFFSDSQEELIHKYTAILREPRELFPSDDQVIRQEAILDRPLDTRNLALGYADGCRVPTIAEAFPVVLEIIRTPPQAVIRDQAGKENYEIIDFRVHLTEPQKGQVPEFYRGDEAQLDDYFKKNFIEKGGIFSKHLIESGQMKPVLNHLIEAIHSGSFATRRAILIVPNNILADGTINPLGLVSIRIIPRFQNSIVTLHYSYTWRTVESMVGFPYSIYGSVKFSEHITKEIAESVLADDPNIKIVLGEVSYIAHSLHMFIDDYGLNIARKIVNDASK